MFLLVLLGILLAAPAAAQVVSPSAAAFAHPDADFAITATYHIDFYACGSVTAAGGCTGRASAPFQVGADVPKASVQNVTPDAQGRNRSINLRQAPSSGVLASMPAGVGYVAAIRAVGDSAIPGVAGASAPSADSNAFFSQARTPVAPGSPDVRP